MSFPHVFSGNPRVHRSPIKAFRGGIPSKKMSQSQKLFQRAQRHIPGGVNSPVRAFRAVGGVPRFIQKGKGSFIWDVDGKRYLDFVMSWGPLILGHVHPAVVRAVAWQARLGTSYGAPTKNEVELAELIKSA